MGLIHTNSGKYSYIESFSNDKDNKTMSCNLRTFKGLKERIYEAEDYEDDFINFKGDDYPLTTETSDKKIRKKLYSAIDLKLDETEYFPDQTEEDYPKIYKFVKKELKFKHYQDIDYTMEIMGTLHPRRTFVKGELQKVEWFADVECTDKVLTTDIVYTRDISGFAIDRITKRIWVGMDEEDNDITKITEKNYTINMVDQIKEGIKRRQNIIDGLQKPILGMMLATITTGYTSEEILQMGRDFLKLHKYSMQAFVDESHKQIQIDFAAATDFWLDNYIDANGTTIRMYILNDLDI